MLKLIEIDWITKNVSALDGYKVVDDGSLAKITNLSGIWLRLYVLLTYVDTFCPCISVPGDEKYLGYSMYGTTFLAGIRSLGCGVR